ncbi:ovarian cancer G-protein coupled receptor 1-like [Rhinophrynus dorsalis]
MENSTWEDQEGNVTTCAIDHTIHQTLFPVVYIAVLVIGLPANCLSLYYGYLQIKAKNELGVYLCNLTVADLLYIFSLPFWLQYVLQHDNWTYNELMCKVCGILLYENIYISVGFLCCISVDRYLAVVHPFRFYKLRTMKSALVVSLIIWLQEIVTSFFFFKHGEVSKDPESHIVCFEHYPIKPWEHNINYYRFLAGFLFPICLMIFSYCAIFKTVRNSQGAENKKKLQVRQLVLSTVVIFLVCFGPYHVLVVIRSLFEKNCIFASRIFNIYHFSLLLTSFNCVADPVLYCFASENTYKDLVRMRNSCLSGLRCLRVGRRESHSLNKVEIYIPEGCTAPSAPSAPSERETIELSVTSTSPVQSCL